MTDFEKEKFFALSSAGILVTMFSALISSISSAIVLNVIRLSPQKLSTTHHRIMSFMSLFDLISSVSMAFVTLPMPKNEAHSFSGPMLGNHQTCQAQGYFIALGIGGSGAIFSCLSWYYVLQMTFHVNSHKMKRIIEPIMYVYSILTAFVWPTYFLAQDFLGPDLHYSYCRVTYYIGSDIEWHQGEWSEQDIYRYYNIYNPAKYLLAYHIILHLALILLAMLIIIYTIYRNTKEMRTIVKQRSDLTNTHDQQQDNHHDQLSTTNTTNTTTSSTWNNLKHTRGVLVQALMYIMAYILTWIFVIMFYIKYEYFLDVGAAVLFPLQGCWNMIIFVYDKAHLLYQTEDGGTTSRWRAMIKVIFSPSQSPGVLMTDFNAARLDKKLHYTIEDYEDQDVTESPPNSLEIDPVYDEISALKEKSNDGEQSWNISISDSVANRDGFLSIASPGNISDDRSYKYMNTRSRFNQSSSQRAIHSASKSSDVMKSDSNPDDIEKQHQAIDDDEYQHRMESRPKSQIDPVCDDISLLKDTSYDSFVNQEGVSSISSQGGYAEEKWTKVPD